jgi:hypothetical protein
MKFDFKYAKCANWKIRMKGFWIKNIKRIKRILNRKRKYWMQMQRKLKNLSLYDYLKRRKIMLRVISIVLYNLFKQ